jgi:hypothetical protein
MNNKIKSLMYKVLSLSALILVILLMYYLVVVEKFENPEDDLKPVNSNILENSIIIQDTAESRELSQFYKNIIGYTNSLNKTIKYTQGIVWSEWQTLSSTTDAVSRVTKLICDSIKEKIKPLGVNVIHHVLNKYKRSKSDILIDYDFVFYKKSDSFAVHSKILCCYNIDSNKFEIVYFKLIGKISDDMIYIKSESMQDDEFAKFQYNDRYVTDIISEDTYSCISSEDKQVENLLYNKLMNYNENHEDYKKNIEYGINQNNVRKMFLNNMNADKNPMNTNNIYKKYPYKNDFVIQTEY